MLTRCCHSVVCFQVKSKELDYYALLGLQHERWMATEAQLKQGGASIHLVCHKSYFLRHGTLHSLPSPVLLAVQVWGYRQ